MHESGAGDLFDDTLRLLCPMRYRTDESEVLFCRMNQKCHLGNSKLLRQALQNCQEGAPVFAPRASE